MQSVERLLLIDGIGPFFRHYSKKRINWSKIPFSSIETDDGIKSNVLETVPGDFRKLIVQSRQLGYNAVSLDDVAHLIPCPLYDEKLQRKIAAYRKLFGQLFEIAENHGMAVYITMDVMFFNSALRRIIDESQNAANQWLSDSLSQLFDDFPAIAGVIMRFGESDGIDVTGDFQSQLWLKRPNDARRFLLHLLPLFESTNRKLVFRTWSVGAHSIGDLNWNPKRYLQVFGSLKSPALVISLKYGESDFFRYLKANPLFFISNHQKIVEFQARREYEGFGAYPSFVGWDSERILDELKTARNLIGMSVWCQTGGWGKRRQLTFLRNSSIWVEWNTQTLALLWQGKSCEEAIEQLSHTLLPGVSASELKEFLALSDTVIKDLLYVRELAERQLYFRRLRLPPQLFVFWDRILIDPIIRKLLRSLVSDHQAAIDQGNQALAQLRRMIELAKANQIPTRGLKHQLATFEIIAAAREYYFGEDPEVCDLLFQLKAEYKRRFKRHYSVIINLDSKRLKRVPLHWMLPLMLRERSRYRLIDQVLTIRLLGLLYPLARGFRHRIGPSFARKQAMGIETLLK